MGRTVYDHCRGIVRETDVLRQLVNEKAALDGVLRLGVAQTIADVAMRSLRHSPPQVAGARVDGMGAPLLQKVEYGELDAAVVLLPANLTLPETLAGESLSPLELAVVAQKGLLKRRA